MPSQVVRSFAYDPAASRLDVELTSGRRYSYHGVPEPTFAAMKTAFAKGVFFNRHIRGRFPFTPQPGEAFMTKRERIEPNSGDARYVRRDEKGHFTDDQTDVGRSSAADQRQHSKTPAKKGEGDRGDRQN